MNTNLLPFRHYGDENSDRFNLIMISAWHEQGGNVFQRHLDSHPQLMVYPYESQISTPLSSNILAGPNHWVAQRYAYPEFTSETTPLEAASLFWDEELKTYLRAPSRSKFKDCGLVMDEKDRIKRFVDLCSFHRINEIRSIPYCPRTRAGFIEAHFRATFDAWSNFARTGLETHYVGYSPPIVFDADKLFSDFPHARMIHVVRNPWSGYSDTKKRPFPMSLAKYCSIWAHVQLAALTYERKYPDRFMIVRYEDLVQDARFTMDRVTAFCGLTPFAPDAVIGPSFNRVPLKEVYPWGTIKTPTSRANADTAHELTTDESIAVAVETNVMTEELYSGSEMERFAGI